MKQALGVSGRCGGLEAGIPQQQVVGNQQPLHAVRHGQREREVARATTMQEGCFEVRAAGPSQQKEARNPKQAVLLALNLRRRHVDQQDIFVAANHVREV